MTQWSLPSLPDNSLCIDRNEISIAGHRLSRAHGLDVAGAHRCLPVGDVESPNSISEISKRVGASARHLERLFSRFFDVSPSQYYMRIRLDTALSLLAKTDLPIVEVALRCGFINASHFTRRYSLEYEQLPSMRRRAGR